MRALFLFLTCLSLNAQTVLQIGDWQSATIGDGGTNAVPPEPPSTNCATLFYGTGSLYTNTSVGQVDGGGNDCIGVMLTTTNTTAICKAAVYVHPSNAYAYTYTLGIYTGDTSGWTDTAVGTVATNTTAAAIGWEVGEVNCNTGVLTSGTNYWLVLKLTPAVGQLDIGSGQFNGAAPTRIRCATKLPFLGDGSNAYGMAFNTWQ